MNGPHGVLEIQGLLVSFSPEGKNITSDAADKGVHALKMRYVDLVCGTRRQKPHTWGYDGIGRRVRLKI